MPRRVTRSTSRPNISFSSDSMSSSSNKLCPAPSAKLTSTSTSLSGAEVVAQHRSEERELDNLPAAAEVPKCLGRDGQGIVQRCSLRCGHSLPVQASLSEWNDTRLQLVSQSGAAAPASRWEPLQISGRWKGTAGTSTIGVRAGGIAPTCVTTCTGRSARRKPCRRRSGPCLPASPGPAGFG